VKALSTQAAAITTRTIFSTRLRRTFGCVYVDGGNISDEEFDEMAAKMTLEGREHLVKCPHIVFHGEFDHLTDTEEVYRYFNCLGSEIKELRIYENEYHGVSRFSDETASMSADWLRDRLNG